jgi:hypothetical protein
MIEILEGFPDNNVLAVSAKDRVKEKDYDDVLIPKLKERLDRYERVRCYYELGPEYSGINLEAMWKDFLLGVRHLSRWERVAVVADVGWIRSAMRAFRFVVPGQMRTFSTSQASDARNWIAAD